VEGFFGEDFSLVVSSPGLDRIIKKQADFEKFKGRRVKVFLTGARGGGSVVGELLACDNGHLRVAIEGDDEFAVKADDYKLVRLVPEIEGYDNTNKKAMKNKGK
jgi:ribosome maturation factor RimP